MKYYYIKETLKGNEKKEFKTIKEAKKEYDKDLYDSISLNPIYKEMEAC